MRRRLTTLCKTSGLLSWTQEGRRKTSRRRDTKNLLKQGNEVRARPHSASSTSSSRVNSSSSCTSSAACARACNSSYSSSIASSASCSRLRRVSNSSSNSSTSSSSASRLASSGSPTPTVCALNKPLTQLLRGQSR
ncbi:unnamed protein product [Closterium sp. NIES-53]